MSSAQKNSLSSYELSPDEQRELYQKSQTFEGQDPVKKSKDDVLREHASNLDLIKFHQTAVKQFVLPAAYAPSISSLHTLQKITLDDLKLETHHRGCFITARTITDPYQSTKIVSILEDGSGTVAKLVLAFQDTAQIKMPSSLPLNSTVAIKEPYCKFNGDGDFVISVDHPSDIAILRGDDPAVTMIMEYVSEKKDISSIQWKAAGDKAYLDKNYPSSIECYTQAIDKALPEELKFKNDVLRKRAFANLTAKFYQSAKDDALASITEDTPDQMAYYCAGKAAYEVSAYEESKTLLEKALKISPGDVKCMKEKKRAIARIREEQEGAYNFETMTDEVTTTNIHLDHANYIKNTVIKTTENHGRGLFSAKAIKAGGLVLCEKAFCLPNLYTGDDPSELIMYNFNTSSRTQRAAQPELFLQLIKKVYNNPHLAAKFFELDAGSYHRSEKEGELIDGVPVVDTFLIEAIRLKNCFSCPRFSQSLLNPKSPPQSNHLSTGLWLHTAYMNHSCLPNCARSFIGDMIIIRATKDIPAGTELTHQYITPDAYYPSRTTAFKQHWDFVCDCKLCTTEARSLEANHKRRQELAEGIKKEIIKGRLSSTTIKHVERLAKKLEEAYEPNVYPDTGIPRLLLVYPTIWLCEAWRENKNPGKLVKYGLEVLKHLGFGDVEKDGKCVLDLSKGVLNLEAFMGVRFAAGGYRGLGKKDAAADFERVAKDLWVILTGSEAGREAAFGIRA